MNNSRGESWKRGWECNKTSQVQSTRRPAAHWDECQYKLWLVQMWHQKHVKKNYKRHHNKCPGISITYSQVHTISWFFKNKNNKKYWTTCMIVVLLFACQEYHIANNSSSKTTTKESPPLLLHNTHISRDTYAYLWECLQLRRYGSGWITADERVQSSEVAHATTCRVAVPFGQRQSLQLACCCSLLFMRSTLHKKDIIIKITSCMRVIFIQYNAIQIVQQYVMYRW